MSFLHPSPRHHQIWCVLSTGGRHCISTPLIARFMGPTWGPSGAERTQVGPMLAPWTLLSGTFLFLQGRPWISGGGKNICSRLLFTVEDQVCANLRVQEQSTCMASQYQYLAFTWRDRVRPTVVTSLFYVRRTVAGDDGEMSHRLLSSGFSGLYVEEIQ